MRKLFLVLSLVAFLSSCAARELPSRYQMVVIPASPPFDDRLVILDTTTGEGKVFTNNYVRGFSFERETLSELHKLKEEEASE